MQSLTVRASLRSQFVSREFSVSRASRQKKIMPKASKVQIAIKGGMPAVCVPIKPEVVPSKEARLFRCDIEGCTYIAKRKTHLKSHKANIHDIDVVWHYCDHCTARFKRASNLKEHKQNKHDIDVVWNYCDICTYRCKQKGNLKKHKALLHNIGRDAYEWRKCDLCDYRCIDKSRLKQHKANIHDIDVVWYNCNLCTYKSKRMCDLRTHKLYKHDIGVVWHKCNMCFYKCKRASDLKRHKANNHSAVALVEYFAEKSRQRAVAQSMLNINPKNATTVAKVGENNVMLYTYIIFNFLMLC